MTIGRPPEPIPSEALAYFAAHCMPNTCERRLTVLMAEAGDALSVSDETARRWAHRAGYQLCGRLHWSEPGHSVLGRGQPLSPRTLAIRAHLREHSAPMGNPDAADWRRATVSFAAVARQFGVSRAWVGWQALQARVAAQQQSNNSEEGVGEAMMTDSELAAIAARRAKITPPPWMLMPELCGPNGQGIFNGDLGCIVEVGDPYPRGDNHPQENMVFLVNAPADIDALLAEVRRLRAQLAGVSGHGAGGAGMSEQGLPSDERLAAQVADLAFKLDPPKPWGLANWTLELEPEETLAAFRELQRARARLALLE